MTIKRFTGALLIAGVIGLTLRLLLIAASGWLLDYDEAMIGLLTMRVLRGEFPVFIPAQATLGAVEPYLLAPFFLVLGGNVVTIRLYALALSLVYIITTGLLTRIAFGEKAGALAALLAAVAPPYLLVTGLKVWGMTLETLILGNLLFLVLHQALQSSNKWRWWALTGLITGIMFWGAFLSFYYLVPAAVVIIGFTRLQQRWWQGLGIALAGFLIGSAPFWLHNLTQDFPTLRILLEGNQERASFAPIISHFMGQVLPSNVTGYPDWLLASGKLRLFVSFLYYGGLIGLGTRIQPGGKPFRWLLLILMASVPLLYLVSGYGDNTLNEQQVDATGRYVLMLHTALPIGLAALAAALSRRGLNFIAAGLIVLTLGMNLDGIFRVQPQRAFASPYYLRQPVTLTPLIDYLDAHEYRYVWTDVGISHVLMFQTRERIRAADYHDAYIAQGLQRFPDVLAEVEAAPYAVFVVPILPYLTEKPPLQQAFDAAGIAYHIDYVEPDLAVFVPAVYIDPAQVAAGLGYQY